MTFTILGTNRVISADFRICFCFSITINLLFALFFFWNKFFSWFSWALFTLYYVLWLPFLLMTEDVLSVAYSCGGSFCFWLADCMQRLSSFSAFVCQISLFFNPSWETLWPGIKDHWLRLCHNLAIMQSLFTHIIIIILCYLITVKKNLMLFDSNVCFF